MKGAVFSDTHGSSVLMTEAVRRWRPDCIIHLGDCERDTEVLRREFPEIPLYAVCGNCDLCPQYPETDVVPLGPVKAFITHGHLYNVSWSTDSLVYAAMERGCKLALYGHTHRAENSEVFGTYVVNPGTAGKGRELTGALIRVFDNGAVAVEIQSL